MLSILTSLFLGHADATLAIIPVLGALGALTELGTAAIGAGNASSKEAQAQKLIEQSVNELKALGVPDEEARIRVLQQMQPILQGQTEFGNVQEDPQLRQAQVAALAGLQDINQRGGMTLQDEANLARIQQQEGAREKGQRDAILQNMAARGRSGSGFELAAQLANQQGAATRANQQGLDVAAQAQKRALDALMQAGQLGGNIRQQDYGMAANKAQAQDAINRFNTANQADMQRYKFEQQNALQQQGYQNDLNKQLAINNARAKQGTGLVNQATQDRQTAGAVASGLGQIGTGLTNFFIDEDKKKQE